MTAEKVTLRSGFSARNKSDAKAPSDEVTKDNRDDATDANEQPRELGRRPYGVARFSKFHDVRASLRIADRLRKDTKWDSVPDNAAEGFPPTRQTAPRHFTIGACAPRVRRGAAW